MLLLNLRAIARCRPMLRLAPGIIHFRFAYRFVTSTLAYMLDSLVRVSRRDGKDHCHRIARRPLKPSDLSLGTKFPQMPATKLRRFHPVFRLLRTPTKCSLLLTPLMYVKIQSTLQTLGSANNGSLPLPSQRFQVF